MTLVLLCNRFPPAVDGVGDYTFHLGIALARLGWTIHIICKKQEIQSPPEGISVHPIVRTWDRKNLNSVLTLIRRLRPDWVSVQYVPSGFQRRGLPFLLPAFFRQLYKSKIRSSITFHEVHVRLQGWKGWLLGSLQRRIARRMCRFADTCVTSIDFYRDLLAPFHRDIRLIPVGANIPRTPLAAGEREALRERLLPGCSFIISTFGRRDLGALLNAVAQWGQTDTGKIGLLACGALPPDKPLPEMPWVHYTGYLPAEKIGAYLQCSDLFALPDFVSERGEGGTCTKSGSLAAAYASGLPVIGVKGDMTNPLLQHGENIWLIAGPNPDSWSKAILELLHNRPKMESLRQAGIRLMEEHLNWDRIAGQYATVFMQSYERQKNKPWSDA